MKHYIQVFAQKTSHFVSHPWIFALAVVVIIVWLSLGPFYNYNTTWLLIFDTISSVVTFLLVFIIQNTQKRETSILNLKLDELIKSHKPARNSIIDLEKLTDTQLQELEKTYKQFSQSNSNE